jgi:hypothetical protein
VQLPANNDFQQAYAVTLLEEMPIYMAHSMFWQYQDRLRPTQSKYWYSRDIRKAATSNLWKRMFQREDTAGADVGIANAFCAIRYTTINDLAINVTGKTLPMGEPGSPWYYEVPSYGEQIPAGRDSEGREIVRVADENDARMYPFRRMMISSEDCIMYDGPAFNWHGELDLIQFCMDSWPWEALGYGLMSDGYDLQEGIDELVRGSQDKLRAQLDMPLGYDINAVARNEALQFDPMQPRSRIGFDGSMVDKPFMPVVPPDVYKLDPEVMGQIKFFEESMDYQMAIRDVVALAKAKAIGKGGNELEALMEAQGPIVKDMSRSMEKPLAQIGNQLKYMIPQYMTTQRVMQYIGADQMTLDTFDYNPSSLVPSHLPGEKTEVGGVFLKSTYSDMQRSRWLAENVKFIITPHTAHEIVQMTYRLSLLQMRQRDIPIDSRTIAEAWEVPDFGTKPEGNTVYERYWNEQEEKIEHALRVQKIAQATGADLGLMQAGPMPDGSGSSKGKGGRPPSGNAPPQQKAKGDGRPVITESK